MSTSNYKDALSEAMTTLSLNQDTVFMGQGMFSGTFMSMTLQDVPKEQKIELPVAEEMQLGMSIGMAMDGVIPISIFPRWNFLILAANQLVNHLDKMKPHVIVRVGIGSEKPLYPGPQHVGNFTRSFQLMMPNTRFIELKQADDIIPAYLEALNYNGPTVLVEDANFYG